MRLIYLQGSGEWELLFRVDRGFVKVLVVSMEVSKCMNRGGPVLRFNMCTKSFIAWAGEQFGYCGHVWGLRAHAKAALHPWYSLYLPRILVIILFSGEWKRVLANYLRHTRISRFIVGYRHCIIYFLVCTGEQFGYCKHAGDLSISAGV